MWKPFIIFWLLTFCFLAPLEIGAEISRQVDKKGNTVISDRDPFTGKERVLIKIHNLKNVIQSQLEDTENMKRISNNAKKYAKKNHSLENYILDEVEEFNKVVS